MAVLLAILVGLSCRQGQNEQKTASLPSQVIEGFTLQESSSGERLYTVEAETAYVFESFQRIDVIMPRVLFYNKDGKIHAELVADQGTVQTKNNDLVARGNVLVLTADSSSLRTDSLCWNNITQLIRTDAAVEIDTPKGHVTGYGLISDAGLNKIEIESEVKGTSEYQFNQKVQH
ncbi:LPS export ABC transporter periplasmic protein LptC [candidate division WOR-3 bacterium JGI_Cruoil_03_51_56]|uniref:LPS export ABC transporter periplasmic protein LptC n=1 Tax=candidate division WOR-3 bacterium JGI_Cruoil_03_51_56 TaxID=1973747 RepID=A0A235BPV7_UNCW3|nr:MAG: LPS export ABC transporter periplasmic protein LptC [candidate division WOR-3 bacterium JGI_Cruoil_03_51_56]